MCFLGYLGPVAKPNRGIGAGCALAMTLIAVYSYTTLEELKQAHKSVPMQLYVDDALLQCEGTWKQVLETIVEAAADWLERVRRDMKGSVSVSKAGVIAKPPALADATRGMLNALGDKYGGLTAEVVQLLGFDATAGVPGLRLVGQLARLAKTQACKPRLQQIATAAGQQATKLVRQGIFPAALYPVPVHGMSGTRLVRLQRTARAATGPKAQESSRTMTLYLAGLDPLALAIAPPLVRWARRYGTPLWRRRYTRGLRERWHMHSLAHGGDSAMSQGCARGGLLMAPSQRPPCRQFGLAGASLTLRSGATSGENPSTCV